VPGMQSFLVRVWQPDPTAPDPGAGLRGVVQALASQVSLPFRSAEELIGCIVLALDGAMDADHVDGALPRDVQGEPPEGAIE